MVPRQLSQPACRCCLVGSSSPRGTARAVAPTLHGHALTNPASPNANGKPSDKLEIPNVTDIMEQNQSNTYQNPSDKEKQKKMGKLPGIDKDPSFGQDFRSIAQPHQRDLFLQIIGT